MMFISDEQLAGLSVMEVEDFRHRGTVVAGGIEIAPGSAVRQPGPKVPIAVPRAQWPIGAKIIAVLRVDSDKGVGSTFERLAEKFVKAKTVMAWINKQTGMVCKCESRRDYLDARYPYEVGQ